MRSIQNTSHVLVAYGFIKKRTNSVFMRKLVLCIAIFGLFVSAENRIIYASTNDEINAYAKSKNRIIPKHEQYESGKIEAGCYSDDRYLYIFLSTNDRSFQMQIINFGLIVNIGNEKAGRNKIVIEYPMVQIVPPPPPNIDQQSVDEKQKKEMEIRLQERINHLLFTDIHGVKNVISRDNKMGFYVNIFNEPERLNYEIRVPLNIISNTMMLKGKNNLNVSLHTPKIDYKKLKVKYGIPKEDRSNGRVPPVNSKFRPSQLEIKNFDINMRCVLQ